MAHKFDSRTLYDLVEIKNATDRAVSIEVSRSLEEWARRAVEGCPRDQIPSAQLDTVDVDLLIEAAAPSGSIERVVENVEHALTSAWRDLYGHSADISWTITTYDTTINGSKKGITVTVKVPVA